MLIPENDIALLIDIYEYATEIGKLIDNQKFYHFEHDKKTRLAVERSFEIIGIAAKKLNNDTQIRLNTIPWKDIIILNLDHKRICITNSNLKSIHH